MALRETEGRSVSILNVGVVAWLFVATTYRVIDRDLIATVSALRIDTAVTQSDCDDPRPRNPTR